MLSRTRLLVFLLVVAALLGLAAPASAVLSGRNGRIAFTSGRQAGDATAQIFTINALNPLLGVSGPFSIPGVQNRHASWSPDRTKLVFASGTPGTLATEEYDLFVKEMPSGSVTPLDSSELGDGLSSDHPAWSPDGTRIAYETQPADPGNDSTDRNIMVKTGLGSADGVPLANSANFELKPAWSPDSQEIYYASSPTPPPGVTQFDIVKKASNAAPATVPTGVAASATVDEYQPSISPDGSRICYTRQSTLGNTATADVYVADLPGLTNQKDISDDTTKGDINCTFSPTGQRIAFSNGTFSAAKLVVENVSENDNAAPFPLTNGNDPGDNDFDGNADWAPDGSPDCPDSSVTTQVNTALTFQVTCTDTGPAYERTNVRETNDNLPASGTLTQEPNGGPFTYTPAANFTGTVSFVVRGLDDFGFGTDTGTVSINVQAPGGGGGNVINGTPGNDTINGTAGDDVINCGAGNDIVNGGGGNDVIDCGAGNDRIDGGAGNDRISGGSGNDRAVGGSGNDRVNGNTGRDRVGGGSGGDRVGGASGNDRVNGDSGNDRVNGDSGNDRVGGGSGNDRVSGGAGKDRVSGGRGNDRVSGGPGNDRVGGDSGRDRLSGGSGRDRLDGGSGRDRCGGDSGRDSSSRCEIRSRIP